MTEIAYLTVCGAGESDQSQFEWHIDSWYVQE